MATLPLFNAEGVQPIPEGDPIDVILQERDGAERLPVQETADGSILGIGQGVIIAPLGGTGILKGNGGHR